MSLSDERVWATIRGDTSPGCAQYLRERLAKPGLFDVTAEEFATTADCDPAQASETLERAVAAGVLQRRITTTCPCCDEGLSDEDVADGTGVCPHCGRAFTDCGSGPEQTVHYTHEAESGRPVPWVLVLHGMNTRGSWQEELSWRIATTYGRSVPVFIYKYGRITTGVLLGWRRRSMIRALSRRVEQLAGEREEDRLGSRPDVIAHSFGTWMLGHALASTEPELAGFAVGRVVLLGSILRPSFDWADVLARGRAKAILNHYGSKDFWAGIGGYVIYDAGPSGRRGFDRSGVVDVVNREEARFGHSTFFHVDQMERVYGDSWKPFLTEPSSRLSALERGTRPSPWRPPPRLLRFVGALLSLVLATAVAAIAATALVLGLIQLVSALVG